jgi:peptidoglycan/xylan/chitin deacetylase (PgdA/CDA1 family)
VIWSIAYGARIALEFYPACRRIGFDVHGLARILDVGIYPMRRVTLMTKRHIGVAAALLCCMAITSETSHSEETRVLARSAPACWAPGELAAKPDEDDVQSGVTQTFAAPLPSALMELSPVRPNMHGSIRSVRLPPGKKLVALTFDLCEGPHEVAGYQGKIVDILRDNDVKATFFMGGKWMMNHRHRAQQLMSDPRFEVGNHTWAHRNLRLLSGSALTDEVKDAERAYEDLRRDLEARQCVRPGRSDLAHKVAPRRLGLFRFPFGACDITSLAEIGELGLLAIQWDVSSDDPDLKKTPDLMTKKILDEVRPGSIVLFHANGRGWYTDDALPGIVSALKAQGYAFATVSELLDAGEPLISPSCYDRSVGDTDQYDELARRLEEQ